MPAVGAAGAGAFFLAFFFFFFFFFLVAADCAATDDVELDATSADALMALLASPPISRPMMRNFSDDRFMVDVLRSARDERAFEVPEAAEAVERPADHPAPPGHDEVLCPRVVGAGRGRA